MKYNYGENELKLFEFFGWNREGITDYPRTMMIRTVGLEVFWKGLSGKEVDAFRRYTRAHENSIPKTEKEWDGLAIVEKK